MGVKYLITIINEMNTQTKDNLETENFQNNSNQSRVCDTDGLTNSNLLDKQSEQLVVENAILVNAETNGGFSAETKTPFSQKDLQSIVPTDEMLKMIGSSPRVVGHLDNGNRNISYDAALQPYLYFTPENLIRAFQATLHPLDKGTKSDFVQGVMVERNGVVQLRNTYKDNASFRPIPRPSSTNDYSGANAPWTGTYNLHRHFRYRFNPSRLFSSTADDWDDDVEKFTALDYLAFYHNGYPTYPTKHLESYRDVIIRNPEQWADKTKEKYPVAPHRLWQKVVSEYELDTKICFTHENMIDLASLMMTDTKMEYRSPNSTHRKRLFFIDRGLLNSEYGMSLLEIASDDQVLIFPNARNQVDVFRVLERVIAWMIRAQHERDYLVVFPCWNFNFSSDRVTSLTWVPGITNSISQFMGGKIQAVLTWMNIRGKELGLWGGNHPVAEVIDRDDGKSHVFVAQHITVNLGGAFDKEEFKYGYSDNIINFDPWADVIKKVAEYTVPEYVAVINPIVNLVNTILSGTHYHSGETNWWIYPVKITQVSMNVQEWMTQLDFWSEAAGSIYHPNKHIMQADYKYDFEPVAMSWIMQQAYKADVPYSFISLKVPISSKWIRLGYVENLLDYVNTTRITINNWSVPSADFGNCVAYRGYIKDVVRRLYIQNNFGSIQNTRWIMQPELAPLRLGYEICSNYCLIPTKGQATCADYMWFDTLVYSTAPGEWYLGPETLKVSDTNGTNYWCYWKPEWQDYNPKIGDKSAIFLEETFLPELEWPTYTYGEWNGKMSDPEKWFHCELKDPGMKPVMCWQGGKVGSVDWGWVKVADDGTDFQSTNTPIVVLSHNPRNGSAIVYIPYLFAYICSRYSVKIRGLDPEGSSIVGHDYGVNYGVPIRYEGNLGPNTRLDTQKPEITFQFGTR